MYDLFLIDVYINEIKWTEHIIVKTLMYTAKLALIFIPSISGKVFLCFLYWTPLYIKSFSSILSFTSKPKDFFFWPYGKEVYINILLDLFQSTHQVQATQDFVTETSRRWNCLCAIQLVLFSCYFSSASTMLQQVKWGEKWIPSSTIKWITVLNISFKWIPTEIKFKGHELHRF